MMEKMKEFGRQYLVEFVGCNPEKIKYVDGVRETFVAAAKESGAKILKSCFHQFTPHGLTAMIFIEESHFSLHTWPEHAYVAFDVLTCGQMNPEIAIQRLREYFEAVRVEQKVIVRGFEE